MAPLARPFQRLSVPAPGRTIQAAVLPWSQPLRDAYIALLGSATQSTVKTELERWHVEAFRAPEGGTSVPLAAASIVELVVTARSFLGTHLPIAECERWFFGRLAGIKPLSEVVPGVDDLLSPLNGLIASESLVDVLPYAFEAFATGPTGASRAADLGHRNDRRAKRQLGAFYTPADVAEYVVDETVSWWLNRFQSAARLPTVLDPACGTGVLMLAALNRLLAEAPPKSWSRSAELCASHVSGYDIDAQAVQAAAFVLVRRCLEAGEADVTPADAWAKVRNSLRITDSVAMLRESEQVNASLFDGSASPLRARTSPKFDVVVANPPYSTKYDLAGEPAYVPFVRMIWEFANSESASAMILPLAVTYNRGRALSNVRAEMARQQALWKIASFDRTPDSLFGDDVKTRNCIALMRRGAGVLNQLHTTKLIRWHSKSRGSLFGRLSFARQQWRDAPQVIPKLGNDAEVVAYGFLRAAGVRRMSAVASGESSSNLDSSCVAYAPTAYNWLSVHREISVDFLKGTEGRANHLCCVRFQTPEIADAAFALSVSNTSYWLWRVEGDGFHLPKGFLFDLPFGDLLASRHCVEQLAPRGKAIWRAMKAHPVVSLNKGVKSISYSPACAVDTVAEVDFLVQGFFGLPEEFPEHLREYVRTNIEAGRQGHPAAKHLQQISPEPE